MSRILRSAASKRRGLSDLEHRLSIAEKALRGKREMTTLSIRTTALGALGREDKKLIPNFTATQVRALFEKGWKKKFRDIQKYASISHENVAS